MPALRRRHETNQRQANVLPNTSHAGLPLNLQSIGHAYKSQPRIITKHLAMASTATACLQQLLLLAILLIPSACSVDPVHHYCGGRNFAGDLIQKANINSFLFNLFSKAAGATFVEYSLAGAENSSTLRGLLQCRPDIADLACLWCALRATNYLKEKCSGQGDGRIWYDDCFLRYSVNDDFFGKAETEHGNIAHNSNTIGANTTAFNDAVGQVLADVVASAASSSDRFGKKQWTFAENVTIYGMAQCTQDLLPPTCGSCLMSAVDAMSKNCSEHTGCRALLSGCGLRYDIVNFFLADDGSQ